MQVKEIENWNKLNAKKLTIVGCDFYYTEAKVVDKNIYTVNLIEQISKDVYFRIDLFLDFDCFFVLRLGLMNLHEVHDVNQVPRPLSPFGIFWVLKLGL